MCMCRNCIQSSSSSSSKTSLSFALPMPVVWYLWMKNRGFHRPEVTDRTLKTSVWLTYRCPVWYPASHRPLPAGSTHAELVRLGRNHDQLSAAGIELYLPPEGIKRTLITMTPMAFPKTDQNTWTLSGKKKKNHCFTVVYKKEGGKKSDTCLITTHLRSKEMSARIEKNGAEETRPAKNEKSNDQEIKAWVF